MAQMDPAVLKSASSSDGFGGYVPFPPVLNTGETPSSRGSRPQAPRVESLAALLSALELAANRTATGIAQGTKQPPCEVRERLEEVVTWVATSIRNKNAESAPIPPVIAREY